MEYLVYKKFYEQEQAEALIDLLQKNSLDFQITEDRDSLDSLYGDNHFKKVYYVKLRAKSFEAANELLLKEISSVALEDDPDHYLHSFTDKELLEVLAKPDEWSPLDYQLSKKILAARGFEIGESNLELLRKQRLNELSRPEESQAEWILEAYLSVLLGGITGVLVGWHLQSYKKTLPDGRWVYGYKLADRKHGVRILLLGVVMMLIYASIWIYNLD
jgi:hypothetical protein